MRNKMNHCGIIIYFIIYILGVFINQCKGFQCIRNNLKYNLSKIINKNKNKNNKTKKTLNHKTKTPKKNTKKIPRKIK